MLNYLPPAFKNKALDGPEPVTSNKAVVAIYGDCGPTAGFGGSVIVPLAVTNEVQPVIPASKLPFMRTWDACEGTMHA